MNGKDSKKPWNDDDHCFFFLNSWEGDSILVHLPGNRWVIIDANSRAGITPTVEFLKAYVDVRQASFPLVHLSHLHRDHECGLAAVLSHLRGYGAAPAFVRIPHSLDTLKEFARKTNRESLKRLAVELERVKNAGKEVLPTNRGPYALNGKSKISEACLVLWPLRGTGFEDQELLRLADFVGYPSVASDRFRELEQQIASIIAFGSDSQIAIMLSDAPKRSLQEVFPYLSDQAFWLTQVHTAACTGILAETAEKGVHLRRAEVLKVPHHGSDLNRMPIDMLESVLTRRRKAVIARLPISVFLSDGRRHPGKECLIEHERVAGMILATAIPEEEDEERERQASTSAVSEAFAGDLEDPDDPVLNALFEPSNPVPYPAVQDRPRSFEPWIEGAKSFAAIVFPNSGKPRLVIKNFVVAVPEERDGRVCTDYRWIADNDDIDLLSSNTRQNS